MQRQKEINTDANKIQQLANKLSQHFWQADCAIPVVWNGRLTRSMGRFIFKIDGSKRIPIKIELSKYSSQFIDRDIFVAVLLHELCHYHLFVQGKPFEDRHPVFEKELQRVGAISTNRVQIPQKAYKLYCSACNAYLGTRKRLNVRRYLSQCCRKPITKKDCWIGQFKYDGTILKHAKVRFLDPL